MGFHRKKKEKVTLKTVLLFGFAFLFFDAFLAFTAFRSVMPTFGLLEGLALILLVGAAMYYALQSLLNGLRNSIA